MKKLILAAALAATPVLAFATPVLADSPGQLSNGPANYKVRNVTQDSAYSQSVAAACNETVKYSITLSNSDFGLLKDLTVKANLATGAINASATNVNGSTTSVAGSVTVSQPGTLQYVNGSTVRITSDGQTRTAEGDGVVTTAGENVGNLNGSTATFVQFEAKVKCDTPAPKNIQVCDLATKNIITIREDQFDAAKHSKDLNKCAPAQPGSIKVCVIASKQIVTIKENEFDAAKHSKDLNVCNVAPATPVTPAAPQVLAATGPAETFAQVIGVTALAGAISYYIRSRRANILG